MRQDIVTTLFPVVANFPFADFVNNDFAVRSFNPICGTDFTIPQTVGCDHVRGRTTVSPHCISAGGGPVTAGDEVVVHVAIPSVARQICLLESLCWHLLY
jgi:hypothetical protein